jgi:diguanylate cyclase (GGDEF)-like protein
LTERGGQVLARRGLETIGVVYVDLDNFKDINDKFGHAAADSVLAEAARRMQAAVRRADMVARIGGDEFVVLLTDLDGPAQAAEVAERLRTTLTKPYRMGARLVPAGASIGVATTAESDAELEVLLANADLAMYAAKAAGRGCIRFFEPRMHQTVMERTRLEKELGAAFDGGQFVLHFQPVIDLDSGAMTGAEALVRWQHPERGLLGPASFLDVLDSVGRLGELTRWVLDQACSWAQARHQACPDERPVRVGVNISPRDLLEPGLVQQVRQALADTGLAGRYLCIEVTETAILSDLEASRDVLRALREGGVAVALDDFGTGYSSLTHLRRLPLDIVKIDRSFVAGLGTEPADAAVVAALLDLTRTLGIDVVAEGVETAQQLAVLRQLGCVWAQGYLFSRPVPGQDLLHRPLTAIHSA